MNNTLVSQVISFFVYLFLQVLFVKNVSLFDVGFCFVYISYLLMLPRDTNSITLMLIGFFFGFLIDLFYETIGIHAASCVFLAYIRHYILVFVEPSGGYEGWMQPKLSVMGFKWFATYSGILIVAHHSILFLIEATDLDLFFNTLTLAKLIFSSLFTFSIIVLFQYIFYTVKVQKN